MAGWKLSRLKRVVLILLFTICWCPMITGLSLFWVKITKSEILNLLMLVSLVFIPLSSTVKDGKSLSTSALNNEWGKVVCILILRMA